MNKRTWQHCFLAIGLSALILSAPLVSAVQAMEDTIIAIVNDEIITLRDLKEYLATIYIQMASSGMDNASIQQAMRQYEQDGLRRLIDDRLIITEAKNNEVIIKDSAIDRRLDEIKKKYSSEQQFTEALIRDGLTITDLRKRLADQLKSKYIVEREVRSKIFVNPQEVTEYYQAHEDRYQRPERLNLLSIFLPFGEEPQKARQTMAMILQQLNEGKNFSALAEEYSQLPPLGIVSKGQLLPEIEKAVFQLEEGQLSQPIETESGVYLFKIKEILPAGKIPLEEVKDEIYQTVFQQKFQTKMQEWLNSLRENAYIEIKQP